MNPLTKFNTVFKTNKPVIAMAHLLPLPGSPLYDAERGVKGIHPRSATASMKHFNMEASIAISRSLDHLHASCQIVRAAYAERARGHVDIAIGKSCGD